MAKYTILSGGGHIRTGKDELDIFYRAPQTVELTDEQAAPLLAAKQAVREGEHAPGPAFTPVFVPETTPVGAPVNSTGAPVTEDEVLVTGDIDPDAQVETSDPAPESGK